LAKYYLIARLAYTEKYNNNDVQAVRLRPTKRQWSTLLTSEAGTAEERRQTIESPFFICILDCTGKLLEKILYVRIRSLLKEYNLLSDHQYGFRTGRSTADVVRRLRNIVESTGKQYKIGVLGLNVKNAFNSAPWHAILESMCLQGLP